jgi:serine/threonine protein kinase
LKSEPLYRAPELFSKKKIIDYKNDVWSCGAILYNMITGIPPFFENDVE